MEQSKLQRTLFVRSPQKVALLALAVVGVVSPVKAADIVYSLIAANGNFSDTNWAPGSDPTVAPSQAAGLTDNLFFGGTPAFTALNVDLAGASFAGFTFDSDATAFTFAGNGFNLGGDFTNNSAATQTVTNTLTIDAVRKVNTNTGNVVLAGNITGAGGLTKTGSGTLTLKGSNAYTGTTIVNAGSLVAQRTTQLALGTGAVTVANGANLTITDHAGGGQVAYANNMTLSGSGTDGLGALKFYNSANFSLTGTLTLSGNTTIGIDAATQTTPITFNAPSGAGGVITGTGNLTLANSTSSTAGAPQFSFTRATGGLNNSYSGDTILTSNGANTAAFVVQVNGSASNRLPTATNLIFGGVPAGAPAGTWDRSVTFSLNGISQQVASVTTANTPAAGNAYRIVGASTTLATIVVANANADTFNGIIGGVGTNNNNIALTHSGAGVLTLGGVNTFTGGTTISGGSVLAASSSALGAGAITLSSTTSAVQLQGGISLPSTNTLNVSAARNVASSGAVLENVSGNNTFAANVSINGTGGNGAIIQSDSGLLSVSGNLQSFDNARGYVFQGAGDISVTGNLLAGTSTVNAKSGAGTLTLSGTNTAAGFAISGGKVVTANTSALGASPVTVTGTGNLTVGDGTVDTIGGLKGLTMSAGTTLAFTGTDSQIQLAGGLFQLNGITLDLNNQFNTPGTYTLIDSVITNSNNTIGTYNVVNGNPGYTYTFSVVGSQDAVLNVAAAVPEPGSLALLGLGGVLALRRRRSV